ncbi:MAG: HAD-IIB family hydrolase, partial [Solibacillus isronensis]
MNEHLIVLDLDGTLLTDEKKISALTKETLLKAKEAGHQVMIATGRPYRASQLYYQELSLTTPIVNFNGALIHHPKNPMWKTIHTTVDLSVVHDVVESVHKYEYDNLIAEVLDDVYLHREDEGVLQLLHMGNPNILTGDLKNTLKENPTSLLIQADDVNTPIIRKHLQDVHAELIEHRRWGAPFPIIEIV